MWRAVALQKPKTGSLFHPSKQNLRKVISLRFLIGLKADVVPGILVIDDKRVVYVCGHNVVICDIKKNT